MNLLTSILGYTKMIILKHQNSNLQDFIIYSLFDLPENGINYHTNTFMTKAELLIPSRKLINGLIVE